MRSFQAFFFSFHKSSFIIRKNHGFARMKRIAQNNMNRSVSRAFFFFSFHFFDNVTRMSRWPALFALSLLLFFLFVCLLLTTVFFFLFVDLLFWLSQQSITADSPSSCYNWSDPLRGNHANSRKPSQREIRVPQLGKQQRRKGEDQQDNYCL